MHVGFPQKRLSGLVLIGFVKVYRKQVESSLGLHMAETKAKSANVISYRTEIACTFVATPRNDRTTNLGLQKRSPATDVDSRQTAILRLEDHADALGYFDCRAVC